MSDEIFSPQAFEGVVRLFPLPNVVLFPRVTLPLHIFEPRYRQMTADALAGDRLIAMVLLKPGYEEEYEHQPPICSVACIGKIIADQRQEDGRYNILLRGISRVRIVNELMSDKLYRTARVELLDDVALTSQQTPELQDQLTRVVASWLSSLGLEMEQIAKLLKSDVPLNTLCDILSFALPLSVEFKQALLEECGVEKRLRQLLAYLEAHEPPAPKETSAQKFPPDFSSN